VSVKLVVFREKCSDIKLALNLRRLIQTTAVTEIMTDNWPVITTVPI